MDVKCVCTNETNKKLPQIEILITYRNLDQKRSIRKIRIFFYQKSKFCSNIQIFVKYPNFADIEISKFR